LVLLGQQRSKATMFFFWYCYSSGGGSTSSVSCTILWEQEPPLRWASSLRIRTRESAVSKMKWSKMTSLLDVFLAQAF
jgi:hypothetical protein